MILRLAAVGAVHGAAGLAMGLTGVLAACTVAQTAQVAARRLRRERLSTPPFPMSPPIGSPMTGGAMDPATPTSPAVSPAGGVSAGTSTTSGTP